MIREYREQIEAGLDEIFERFSQRVKGLQGSARLVLLEKHVDAVGRLFSRLILTFEKTDPEFAAQLRLEARRARENMRRRLAAELVQTCALSGSDAPDEPGGQDGPADA